MGELLPVFARDHVKLRSDELAVAILLDDSFAKLEQTPLWGGFSVGN
jgi:hypothetical protein